MLRTFSPKWEFILFRREEANFRGNTIFRKYSDSRKKLSARNPARMNRDTIDLNEANSLLSKNMEMIIYQRF